MYVVQANKKTFLSNKRFSTILPEELNIDKEIWISFITEINKVIELNEKKILFYFNKLLLPFICFSDQTLFFETQLFDITNLYNNKYFNNSLKLVLDKYDVYFYIDSNKSIIL